MIHLCLDHYHYSFKRQLVIINSMRESVMERLVKGETTVHCFMPITSSALEILQRFRFQTIWLGKGCRSSVRSITNDFLSGQYFVLQTTVPDFEIRLCSCFVWSTDPYYFGWGPIPPLIALVQLSWPPCSKAKSLVQL